MIPFRLRNDPLARWRHVDGGLSLTKKRLGEFTESMLRNGGHIGDWWAFNPAYKGSSVYVSMYLTPEIEAKVVEDCPWLKVIDPPKVTLN